MNKMNRMEVSENTIKTKISEYIQIIKHKGLITDIYSTNIKQSKILNFKIKLKAKI